jgi:hypothetical protein
MLKRKLRVWMKIDEVKNESEKILVCVKPSSIERKRMKMSRVSELRECGTL